MDYQTGKKYVGEFEKGSSYGFGKLTFSLDDDEDRLEFEGFFEKDEMQGNGTLQWKNGERYDGYFYKGQIKGNGIKYGADGAIVGKGHWEKGILIFPE